MTMNDLEYLVVMFAVVGLGYINRPAAEVVP